MPLRTFCAWCVFFAFFTASVPAQVAGQRRQPPKQQRPKQNQKPPATQPVTLEGTLQAVASNQLEVLAEAPARDKRRRADKNAPVGKWTVAVQPGTTLVVLGEAKPDYLRAGQMVEFTGDPANMDVNRLSNLTVLAPVRKSKPAGGAKAAAKGEEAGFADPNRITGRLDKQQGNKWSVRMGAKTVEIEVADNAKITVMLANAKLVSVGDRVIVRGTMLKGKPGACMAQDMKVTLSKPLTASVKKTTSPKLGPARGGLGPEEGEGGVVPEESQEQR